MYESRNRDLIVAESVAFEFSVNAESRDAADVGKCPRKQRRTITCEWLGLEKKMWALWWILVTA